MMKKRRGRIAVLAGLVGLLGGPAAWAIPDLQLTFETGDNPGADIFYDGTSETTVIEGGGTYTLKVYAMDTAFHQMTPRNHVYLTMSLDPADFGEFDDPSGITIWVDGVQVAPPWTYGTPPSDTGATDMGDHPEFPSWYTEVRVSVYTLETEMPDVVTGEVSDMHGYSTTVDIVIEGNEGVGIHIDAWTPVYDEWGNPILDEAYRINPYTHDAEIAPPVPEPATAMLLIVGACVVAGGVRRRRGHPLDTRAA